ncbi:MAG: DNA-directed RNA polymerase subunit alpha [Candidatus Aureabacteria bacterium]|nr:DNA-directed RNA polymerase subunit alpha [Candidatus Auribacterota bacterium]
MAKFEFPKRLTWDEETVTATYAKFIAEPFERGYGFTLGNALRRVLLSSLEGAAITDIKIEGVLHEFSTVPGVLEDVTQIILNLKQVVLKMDGREPRRITLSANGEKTVTAGDIKTGGTVEVVNPEHHLATLNKGAVLKIEMSVGLGRGFRPSEMNKIPDSPIGVIPVDSIFSPVRKVNILVEDTRVGQLTDYNRLILEIWTDGRLSPRDALIQSAALLNKHLDLFTDEGKYSVEFIEEAEAEKKEDKLQKILSMPITEIELSVRSTNCIKAAEIQTLGDLVRKNESEMLQFRNFGKKSLEEIKNILTRYNLRLGMKLPPAPGDELKQLIEE